MDGVFRPCSQGRYIHSKTSEQGSGLLRLYHEQTCVAWIHWGYCSRNHSLFVQYWYWTGVYAHSCKGRTNLLGPENSYWLVRITVIDILNNPATCKDVAGLFHKLNLEVFL